MHTASPFLRDVEKEGEEAVDEKLIHPALEGTKTVLQSVAKHKDTVKCVALTSSVAAMSGFGKNDKPLNGRTYTGSHNKEHKIAHSKEHTIKSTMKSENLCTTPYISNCCEIANFTQQFHNKCCFLSRGYRLGLEQDQQYNIGGLSPVQDDCREEGVGNGGRIWVQDVFNQPFVRARPPCHRSK